MELTEIKDKVKDGLWGGDERMQGRPQKQVTGSCSTDPEKEPGGHICSAVSESELKSDHWV